MAADLEFRIGADLAEIRAALGSLRTDLQSIGRTAQSAGGENAFNGLQRSAQSAVGQIKTLVAGFVSLAAAIKLIGIADEFQNLNARLKLATQSVEDFARAQEALFRLSQETSSSLSETIGLYSRIAQATKDAGVGQEVLLGVVRTINQAVQLSGSSAQAAEAALVQLGQGLASGTLRGEELNSILEQTPALADAIAKGLNITRGELRKYGEEGKLTAQAVIDALQNQASRIDQEFSQLPLTFGRAVTQLSNSFQRLVGIFDQTSGATGGLAEVIKDLADFLASDEAVGSVIEFGAIWSRTFQQITEDVRSAVAIIRNGTRDIAGSGEDLVSIITRAFRELPVNLRATVQILTVTFAGMVDSFIADARLLKEVLAAVFTDDTIEEAVRRRNARVEAAKQAVVASIDDILAERARVLEDSRAVRETAEETRRLAARRNTSAAANAPGNFKRTISDKEQREADALRKAQIDAQEKLEKDSSDRQLAAVKAQFEDSAIAAQEYYRRREQLELEALDRAIAIERQRAQAGGADRVKAEAEITLLERRKTDVITQAARDRAAFERQLIQQLDQARAQGLENEGQTAAAARLRLELQYRDLLQRLEAEGNQTGVRLIQGLIDTGASKARFDELKRQADETLAQLDRRRQDIEARVRLGTTTPEQGRQEEVAATLSAIGSLTPVQEQLAQLAATLKDPALVAAANALGDALARIGERALPPIEQLKNELRATLADMQANIEKTVASAGVNALTNLFTDLATGSKTAGDALRDFVRGFITSMAQIAARALATYAVLQLLDAIYPGLGKTVAAAGSIGANVKHGGGMAGTGPIRRVNPLLFMGAPRYHAGGMVGLKSDERPAILQTGEEVLSRGDRRNQANGGGGVRVINVIDPSLVSDYMTSSAGEKAVLNVLQRNPGAVRQALV